LEIEARHFHPLHHKTDSTKLVLTMGKESPDAVRDTRWATVFTGDMQIHRFAPPSRVETNDRETKRYLPEGPPKGWGEYVTD